MSDYELLMIVLAIAGLIVNIRSSPRGQKNNRRTLRRMAVIFHR